MIRRHHAGRLYARIVAVWGRGSPGGTQTISDIFLAQLASGHIAQQFWQRLLMSSASAAAASLAHEKAYIASPVEEYLAASHLGLLNYTRMYVPPNLCACNLGNPGRLRREPT